jgi:xanthosine utilization system XapX-like protein
VRYTKKALLVFGAGLLLGLLVVSLQLTPLGRVASGLMALGLLAIPVGFVLDWRKATIAHRPAPAKRRRRSRRGAAAPRRRARPKKPRTPAR